MTAPLQYNSVPAAAGKPNRPPARNRRTIKPARLLPFLAGLLLLGITGVVLWNGARPTPAQAELPVNTLVEFGDFNCPYCAFFAVQTLPRLHRDYIDNGRMAYQYRHYPFLSEGSRQAAIAAECAREQDAFTAFHDRIYLELATATLGNGDPPDPEDLSRVREIGAAAVEYPGLYRECLRSARAAGIVETDLELGRRLGVPGTPTLFLNGIMLDHRLVGDYARLTAELDRLLALGPQLARPTGDTAAAP